MVAVAVRSQLDVRALPMTQDAQLQLALAALLILLLVSHYLPAEMLAGRAFLLLNRATAQVFSTPVAALETAAPVAREERIQTKVANPCNQRSENWRCPLLH
ncbi:uncharacterized protein LOC135221561 [Macrobrachium nipponense]|uniref:uncharacterized protein LOC135221561 n=1 Tax=Macrobrachium nipponense TaxID=159736 RepID=UPI0030C87F2A